MNVLLLSQFFSTTRGGGEYVFSILAKLLAEEGDHVWVITNKIKGENYLPHKNIKIIFVPPTLEYKGGLPPSFSENITYTWNTVFKGFSIIKKEKINIIHSNNFSPALAGSILSAFTSKPHITTIHDLFSINDKDFWNKWAKQNNVSKINAFLTPVFEKMMIRLKHVAIHTVSDATKKDLLKIGTRRKIFVIPNSIEYDNNYNKNEKTKHFICVGRLVFYKNLEVIIKAINILKKSDPSVKLIIVGGGPHRKNLEKMVQELKLQNHVKFTGFVSNKEKIRLIRSAHALLFPSLYEGFGLVLLEAFAQRRPVLVSNVKPLSDIVTNDINGLIISPYDEKEWAAKMQKILHNHELADNMGARGRELLEKEYNPQIMKERIINMYKEFL